MNTDVYTRVTDKIIAQLEQGERPWMKPWNADHAAGKITRPLRHNGLPYAGINRLAPKLIYLRFQYLILKILNFSFLNQ
jgi:antirestriction protein ArdC